jgi:MFS family permease
VNVGSRFLRPFYFENLKLVSPQISGLLMMVAPLIMFILSPLAKSISKRLKHKKILILANVLLAASMFWFSRWDAQTAIWQLVTAMVLLGISMGLYYPVNSLVGMQSLPAHQSGMGSAAMATSKSMGKLMGVLIFAVFFTHLNSLNDSISPSTAYEFTFLMGSVIALIATLLSVKVKNEKPGSLG